jgi:hypothetical protein
VRIVECDATAFSVPDTPCVYYFYNPFSLELMKAVIHNITESCLKYANETYLICVGMSTIIPQITRIKAVKLRHSFYLSINLFHSRSVYIFLVTDD